jgi:hypothetical protein
MLPAISRAAEFAARTVPPAERLEFVAEVIAGCFVSFARLVERGQAARAFPSALVGFAAAQIRAGRRVGGRMRRHDALSRHTQRRQGFVVMRLDERDDDETWSSFLIQDRRASPAEVAAWRLDFAAWLDRLPTRARRIANTLGGGETTSGAAKIYQVSPSRIAQIRRWFERSWRSFQGESIPVDRRLRRAA